VLFPIPLTDLTFEWVRSGVSVKTNPYLIVTLDPITAFDDIVHLLPKDVLSPISTFSLISQYAVNLQLLPIFAPF